MDRFRKEPESNYLGVFSDGKTWRFPIHMGKPILPLENPEFWDVKITNVCDGGCPYCYQDSSMNEKHPLHMPEKIMDFFGPIPVKKRPFQVAIGGGEPTMHPEFVHILECFSNLGIVPNYTTNGWAYGANPRDYDSIMGATKRFCGGVAVTAHQHLNWSQSARAYMAYNIHTDLHFLISDSSSFKNVIPFLKHIDVFEISHFVLLPIVNQGRAKSQKVDYDALFEELDKIEDISRIAFGSQAYSELIKRGGRYAKNLYDPEMFSRYVDLTGDAPMVAESSFDTKGMKS